MLVLASIVTLCRAQLVLGWVMFMSSNCVRMLWYLIIIQANLAWSFLWGSQNEYWFQTGKVMAACGRRLV